jgi:muramoyltetrapeptide carboxypeptidase
MESLKPKAPGKGGRVRIVSPASPLSEEKLAFAVELLRSEGFRVELAPHALEADAYLAGADQARALDLQEAFADPSVDVVFCARGGYGSARLLPYLDLDRMAGSRKLFWGFSDVTTLHVALNRRGLPTVHGPMAITLSVPREGWVLESFCRVLMGDLAPPAGAHPGRRLVPGVAEGIVAGGCLCLLADTLGTAEAFEGEGKIVLLEDVDESPHRVDAMLTHLLHAGAFAGAAGIAVGEMTRTDDKVDQGIGGRPWREIVADRLAALGIPIITDYPQGHMQGMLSLPLGLRARLDADAGTLTYLEPLYA